MKQWLVGLGQSAMSLHEAHRRAATLAFARDIKNILKSSKGRGLGRTDGGRVSEIFQQLIFTRIIITRSTFPFIFLIQNCLIHSRVCINWCIWFHEVDPEKNEKCKNVSLSLKTRN